MKIKLGDIFSKRNLFVGGLVLVLGFVAFFIFFYANGTNLYNAIDSSSKVFLILFFVGGLVFVIECGMFDVVSVGFANIFAIRKGEGKRYASLYDYKEVKRIKRSSDIYLVFPFLLDGILFGLAAFIMFLVWKNTYIV